MSHILTKAMHKKRNILVIAFILIVMSANAIPAKKGVWRTIRLTDGTELLAQLVGDEFTHYMRDANGNAYVADSLTGAYQLADRQQLVAKAQTRKANSQVRRARRAQANALGNFGNYIGDKKGLIILVEFADSAFRENHDSAFYDKVANTVGFSSSDGFVGSVHDYFYAQSEGQFNLTFDVVGPVVLSKGFATYGKNDASGYDVGDAEFARDAINAAADLVDFSKYDWDGDGEVEQVFLLYAGTGENNGGGTSTIWPHEWTLSSGLGKTLTLNGVVIDTYACSCELQPVYKGTVIRSWIADGIGAICHEFSHCLGFPDMYDTNYEEQGMGFWDLMDSGSYCGGSFCPVGYTSYERWMAGWKTPIELADDSTKVSGMKALSDGGDAYIMYNNGHKDEYFLLENRQHSGWDLHVPDSGLVILHVDYNSEIWDYNVVNTLGSYTNTKSNSHQRLTWVAADNDYTYTTAYQYTGDAYPISGNDSFGNATNPAATLYNKNTDGTYNLNKELTNITRNADGTISFSFNDINGPALYTDTLFYESFDQCDGTGGSGDTWAIQTKENIHYTPDHSDWSMSYVRGGYQCAVLGSSGENGTATTPSITLDGDYILSFKAAPWGTNAGKRISVAVYEGDATLSTLASDTLICRQWTDYSMTLSGNSTIKLLFFSSENRFFLDEVLIAKPTSTAIQAVNADRRQNSRAANNRIYSLSGTYLGTDINQLPAGIYIRNGKKIIK